MLKSEHKVQVHLIPDDSSLVFEYIGSIHSLNDTIYRDATSGTEYIKVSVATSGRDDYIEGFVAKKEEMLQWNGSM